MLAAAFYFLKDFAFKGSFNQEAAGIDYEICTSLVLQWHCLKIVFPAALSAMAQVPSRNELVVTLLNTAPTPAKKQTGSLTSVTAALTWRAPHPPGTTSIVCARTMPNTKAA